MHPLTMAMALFLFRDWPIDMEAIRPSRLLDQQFGMGLTEDDILNSALVHLPLHRYYLRPWRADNNDIGSTIKFDKDGFQVNLDVQQFSPEEIQVKVVDNCVVVEGKHEEKQDEHGFISRHFVRRYAVPKEYKLDGIASSLSSDGVLTISAPKAEAIEGTQERVIPITQTGPHKAVSDKPKEKSDEL